MRRFPTDVRPATHASILWKALEGPLSDQSSNWLLNAGSRQITGEELLAASIEGPSVPPGLDSRVRLRVLLMAPNSLELVTVILAALRRGHVPFVLDPSTSAVQAQGLQSQCGIDLVWTPDEVRTLHPDSAARPALHPTTELARFTTGSTRTPACIEYAGTAVLNAGRGWAGAVGLTQRDSIACFAGLHNGLAFNAAFVPALITGARLHLSGSPLPTARHVLDTMRRSEASVLVAPPAVYDVLAGLHDLGGVARPRLAFSSAAPLSPRTASTMWERHGIWVSDYYGLAETGPITCGSRPGDLGQGPLMPHTAARVDDGQLIVRSTSMGTSYLNHPGKLESRITEDGWYRTGDVGKLVEHGLVLGERLGKGINIAGRKISGDAVRDVIMTHAAVRDAHVLSPPNSSRPELVSLVALDPAHQLTASGPPIVNASLRQHCLTHLARHEVPSRFLVVDSVPRNSVGKVRQSDVDALTRNTDHP